MLALAEKNVRQILEGIDTEYTQECFLNAFARVINDLPDHGYIDPESVIVDLKFAAQQKNTDPNTRNTAIR